MPNKPPSRPPVKPAAKPPAKPAVQPIASKPAASKPASRPMVAPARPVLVAKPAVTPSSKVVGPNFLPVTKPGATSKAPATVVAQPKAVMHPPVAGRPLIVAGLPAGPKLPVVSKPPIVAKPPVTLGHGGTATAPAQAPPKVVSAGPAKPQPTPQLNNIKFIDPSFARNIINLRPPMAGSPREQMKVPISPVPEPNDGALFEDPVLPAKKYYLPRYKLATDHQKYEISFQQDDSGWSFVVKLIKLPAPSIAAAAKGAQEIDHHVAVLVRFSQMIGNQAGAQEELSFQEVTLKDGVLTATLHLDSLPQRDLLYQALQDRTFGTTLIVRRAVTLAVPVPQPITIFRMPGTPPPAPTSTAPQYRQTDRVLDDAVDPSPFVFSPDLHKYIFSGVTPESSSENLGLTRYQVAWTDGRSYTYYRDGAKPQVCYYLPDCFKLARRQDGAHEPLVSASFGQAASADSLKATFSFIAVPYVDPKRLEAAGPKLKDSIGQLPQGLTGPQFEPLLAAPGKIHFSLSYPGCDTSKGPYELRDKASVDLRSGIHDSLVLALPQFQSLYDALFSPSSVLLTGKVDVDLGADTGEEIPFSARLNDLAGDFLALSEAPLAATATDSSAPTSDGSDSGDSNAPSIKDSVTSALGDAVEGDVGGAVADVLGGLAGKLFHKGKKDKKDKKKKKDPEAPPPPAEPGLQATWQNIIESPVEIASLTVTLVRSKESLPATVDGLDLSQPVQIPPGQQISFNVIPTDATPAGDPVHAEYNFGGVHPVPDREAIWNEILDPTAAESYLTTITVKTPASTFAAPADNPDQQIVSMVVDFDSGVSAELNSTKLEAKVDLPHPVVNYVLRKPDTGQYRYKVNLVRAGGDQTKDNDWRSPETTTVLFPAVK